MFRMWSLIQSLKLRSYYNSNRMILGHLFHRIQARFMVSESKFVWLVLILFLLSNPQCTVNPAWKRLQPLPSQIPVQLSMQIINSASPPLSDNQAFHLGTTSNGGGSSSQPSTLVFSDQLPRLRTRSRSGESSPIHSRHLAVGSDIDGGLQPLVRSNSDSSLMVTFDTKGMFTRMLWVFTYILISCTLLFSYINGGKIKYTLLPRDSISV